MSTRDAFADMTVLVTGASSGIGLAVVEALCARGARVIAAARDAAALERVAAGTGCTPCAFDVGDEAAIARAFATFGPLDGLVNCAGVAHVAPALDTDGAAFDAVMAINARGAALVARQAARAMLDAGRTGSIVNVSSQAALVALDGHLAYCASKAALDAITRTLCIELGPHGIRVNSVNPTVTLTPMAEAAWRDPERRAAALRAIPLGRFAQPRDVVEPVLFLLSDAAAMISGVSLPVDGGYTAR
jgi:NAD(P)-dependent dehydrogenase (short-subunit alcohol dehydrogenase family)